MPPLLRTTAPAIDLADTPNDPSAPFIDLTFPATELYVRWAISTAVEKLSVLHIAPDFQFTVEIVLAELLNNIVEHGYPGSAYGDIRLKISTIEDRIEIATKDRGIQMPGLRAPHPQEPDLNVDRQDLPEGQFGWYMMRKLCEDLEYRRVDTENQFTLNITQ